MAVLGSVPVSAQEFVPLPRAIVRGRVRDATTGEPIAKALVSVRESRLETVTDNAGQFVLVVDGTGDIELYVTTVGYGLIRKRISLAAAHETELDILLGPEAITRTDEVTVSAAVFEPLEPGAATEQSLNQTELKNLAGVVVDDPLRAVQGLPGIAAGDDFSAQFAVRGSGFNALGFYIDGVMATTPFHTVYAINNGGSMSIINGDLVESVSLISGAAPARFGDRTGAVLNIQTREGHREKFHPRGNISSTGLWFTGEGPLDQSHKASWLGSVRKSFLDYVINRVAEDAAIAFGYFDVQGKLAYHPTERHQMHLTILHGDSGVTRDRVRLKLGVNSLYRGDSQSDIVNLQWRWLPSSATLFQAMTYLTRDFGKNFNRNEELLFRQESWQGAVRADLSRQIYPGHMLEAGFLDRKIQDKRLERSFDSRQNRFVANSAFSAHTFQPGFYIQDSWTALRGKLTLTAGLRADRLGFTGENVWTPRAGLAVALGSSTTLTAGFGQYAQFPAFPWLLGEHANRSLRAERSTQYVTGLEHLLNERLRLRAEIYYQEEKNGIFTPEAEYRLVAGRVVSPRSTAPWLNVLRGHSRGVEVFLQRRSANKISGWLGYSYGVTRLRDDPHQLSFIKDFDQRHTVNVYGSVRATQTLNLSAKYRYGSNFPIIGFYRRSGDLFYLSNQRNTLGHPAYSRLDIRLNKACLFDRWKLTLYFEVINLLNRRNERYAGLDRITISTQQVVLNHNSLFPILPTAGLLFEF